MWKFFPLTGFLLLTASGCDRTVNFRHLRREFYPDLLPLGIHFLGKDRGQGRHRALAHLSGRIVNYDLPVIS